MYIGTDPLTEKEKTTTRSGFKTKREVKEALAQIQQEIRKGTFRKQAIETYIEIYELIGRNLEQGSEILLVCFSTWKSIRVGKHPKRVLAHF